MIKSKFFYCPNKDKYPPFKDGLYLEEYFLKKHMENKPQTSRKYIPSLWTNFQIEGWFSKKQNLMQKYLNKWIRDNPSENGYFTVVQYDDACLLKLPSNTIVYGACTGDKPVPLIYQDVKNKLVNEQKKSFNEKSIFCSFVGTITQNNVLPNVREEMVKYLRGKEEYKIFLTSGWTPDVNKEKQDKFIQITLDSKFSLAPRGYGRSSFRFFEIYQLGSIPIYLWNDIEWLPFKEVIDYSKICVSLNIREIDKLDGILKNIDEEKYKEMWREYDKVKHYFTLEGMYNRIIEEVTF